MIKNNRFAFLFIGLALFAMYFGSGNLIYPLYLGQLAQDQTLLASCGFLLTAVALPFLGVIAMIIYRGDYIRFFSILGDRMGFCFVVLLLTVWAPLGCCPRCITVAYAGITNYMIQCPLWLFSLIYTLLVYFIIEKKQRMMHILGYFLTPLLLLSLCLIIFKEGNMIHAFALPKVKGLTHFYTGLIEGYNTIDLIASFFFSATIISMLNATVLSEVLKVTYKACLCGVILLGIVYIGMIGLAGIHSSELAHIPKEQMLIYLAQTSLGSQMGAVAILTIFLACLSTSVAQTVVYADFLQKTLFKKQASDIKAKVMALTITFVMSLTGLEGISLITVPTLKLLYPLLMLAIIYNLVPKASAIKKSKTL